MYKYISKVLKVSKYAEQIMPRMINFSDTYKFIALKIYHSEVIEGSFIIHDRKDIFSKS